MKDYEHKLAAKCYTKERRLHRPRRCKSRAVKSAEKQWREAWKYRPED